MKPQNDMIDLCVNEQNIFVIIKIKNVAAAMTIQTKIIHVY